MITIKPKNIYYEEAALDYDLGKILKNKYSYLKWIPIENHNNIPCMREKPNCEFAKMKQDVIVAVRKTHKFVPNNKTSDFLVPYTSSGCTASCLYCYLVCNYNKCSYLRIFVNRELMLSKIIKTARSAENDLVFEIGSNSDLVLENVMTGNLEWTIENFGREERGFLTLPTKFDMVDRLLYLKHNGRTIIRISVNPQEIINKVEFGTSSLLERIKALNRLCDSGYKVGLLVAPIILLEDWQELYLNLFMQLEQLLSEKAKKGLKIEVIFMTYSYIHRMINNDAFPKAVELYDADLMTGRGKGRYCYKQTAKEEAEVFIRDAIKKYLPDSVIEYIV